MLTGVAPPLSIAYAPPRGDAMPDGRFNMLVPQVSWADPTSKNTWILPWSIGLGKGSLTPCKYIHIRTFICVNPKYILKHNLNTTLRKEQLRKSLQQQLSSFYLHRTVVHNDTLVLWHRHKAAAVRVVLGAPDLVRMLTERMYTFLPCEVPHLDCPVRWAAFRRHTIRTLTW